MPSSKALRFCFLRSLAFLTLAAHAQQARIAQVLYENPGPFTQQQLAGVTGLKPGDPATAATLQAAAQKLSDTGFFDDVGAEIRGTTAHLIAAFQLKPTPRSAMVSVGYENFVWLTPQEIDTAIHAAMPLYFGALQENTVQVDQLNSALENALAAKGISAKVEHETIEPTLQHPLRAMEFRVAAPRTVVANIKLTGVTPELVPLVQASVNGTAHRRYNAGLAGDLTAESILAPLLNAGYIDAALTSPTLDAPPPDAGIEPVTVHAALSAGEVYKLTSIAFAGTPLLSAEAFNAGLKLHPGDVASRKLLLETLTPLDTAYRRQGYLDVIIQAAPSRETAAHTVAYTVTVTPGEPYRLAKATAEGLDPAAQADFDKYFKLKPGDLFDPTYVAVFIKNNTALRSLATYTGTWRASADPNKHTVDVTLKFFSGPTVNVH